MTEQEAREPSSYNKQRRILIQSPIAAAILFLTQSCSSSNEEQGQTKPSSLLPEVAFTERPLIAVAPKPSEPHSEYEFSIDYVRELIADLKKTPKKNSVDDRWQALKENSTYIQLITSNGIGEGSAIKICESGYYLSAAHIFVDKDFTPIKWKSQVYLPTSGAVNPIKSVVFDPGSDLAIFYAPSGKNRRKVEGLQINDSQLSKDEKLWLLGLAVGTHNNMVTASLGIPFGQVDERGLKNIYDEDAYVLVKGMIPYGGSSGGAVINTRGDIVAIESGSWIDPTSGKPPVNSRDNYTHAIISPISNLERLYNNKVNLLPTK